MHKQTIKHLSVASSVLVLAALLGGCNVGNWFAEALDEASDAAIHATVRQGVNAAARSYRQSDNSASGQAVGSGGFAAHVDHVSDGDTVSVIRASDGKKLSIRLSGVDAPEVNHGGSRPGQKLGEMAKATMEQILAGGQVTVIPDGSRSYNRVVGRIVIHGSDAGKLLVQRGMAWRYPRYDKAGRYTAAQASAQQRHIGIWAQSNPTPPWTWRHTRW